MAFCTNCGAQLPENAASCPACGAVVYQHIASPAEPAQPQQAFQPAFNQQSNTYYQPPKDSQVGAGTAPTFNPAFNPAYPPQQQTYFPPNPEQQKSISGAKIFGLLGIILGVFVSPLLGWILGGIGLSKANQALQYAIYTGDMMLQSEAKSAKTLAKASVIVASVICVLIVLIIALAVAAGVSAGDMSSFDVN